MNSRTAFLRILLAFLLLFSQQMGLAHALSHLDAPRQQASPDQHLPDGERCDQCLAFAGAGTGITGHAVVFNPESFDVVAVSVAADTAFSPATPPSFEARAPPSRF